MIFFTWWFTWWFIGFCLALLVRWIANESYRKSTYSSFRYHPLSYLSLIGCAAAGILGPSLIILAVISFITLLCDPVACPDWIKKIEKVLRTPIFKQQDKNPLTPNKKNFF